MDDLYAERFGRSTWWKTPEKTASEEAAAIVRQMLLRAWEFADEQAEAFGEAS